MAKTYTAKQRAAGFGGRKTSRRSASRSTAPRRRRVAKSTKLGGMAAGLYVAGRAVLAGKQGGIRAAGEQVMEDTTGYVPGQGFNLRAPVTTLAVGLGGKVAGKVANRVGINKMLGGATKKLIGRRVVV